MRNRTKLAITALAATTALAALITTATARNLSFSNQNVRATFSSIEFVPAAGVTLRCMLTLEGSFHGRSIVKSAGALLGYVTRAIVRHPCTGGTVWAHSGEANEVLGGTFSNNLPWHIQYGGFSGTLPNITGIRIVLPGALFSVRATFFGIALLCEYVTDNEHGNAIGTANIAGGTLTNAASGGRIRSRTSGCPDGNFGNPTGDGTITLLGNTTRITVTLI